MFPSQPKSCLRDTRLEPQSTIQRSWAIAPWLAIFLTCMVAALECQSLHAARPNVILFVTDDQSPDAGCYGNDVIRTPNLDRLASDGIVFTDAFCTTASCSASRSVILSGLHNHLNGQYGHVHSYHHFQSFDSIRGLPNRLSEAGYHTVRIGKYHVAPESAYQFDKALPGNSRNPVAMADIVKEHLIGQQLGLAESTSRTADQPFFLYFCTSDPHRGGGQRDDLPNSPNAFGNRIEGYPGVESTYYDPSQVIVPEFLPDTATCRAEIAMYYQSISRIDQGLGRLVGHLHELGVYENTVIIYTSDHGMAFPGAKTTLYEPGMHVPMVVKGIDGMARDARCPAMLSHIDLTPTILDLAEAYDNADNPSSDFHGRSWKGFLNDKAVAQAVPEEWQTVYASHTFHEIQMYYPMRVVHRRQHKLIWNIAHQLPYPFASDLWAAPTWQAQFRQGEDASYGKRSVAEYIHRPEFELYDLQADPHESRNLAEDPEHRELLDAMKTQLREFQKTTQDPWIVKWEYE